MNRIFLAQCTALVVAILPWSRAPAADPPFIFRDVAETVGLHEPLRGMMIHAAAWGDVDGDGWLDLYVGTFHEGGSKLNRLLRNSKGKFAVDAQPVLRVSGRASGSVFVDLDNDGDLDLYLSNMAGGKHGSQVTPNFLFRNDGTGKFTDVSEPSGACPAGFKGRSATVLDFDGDGLLDLLVGEDPWYSKRRSRLFRNKGDLRFEDVSDRAGLPTDVPALGTAAADVNDDGWPDIFLASRDGGNRLFLNDGQGQFREAPGTREVFAWRYSTADDSACGVCFGDVNRDGLLDIVIGQHYKRPWQDPKPVRLYLNLGVKDGNPAFKEITAAAGLKPLPLKGPHVEIQDFDNDGWPDIYVSIVKFADGRPHPFIFKNLGVRDGIPRFKLDALSVNDFPTEEDRRTGNTGKFYDKMIADKKIIYMAPGPSADYDKDGRLDLLLPNWWLDSRSLLLRNETQGGNWLQVHVDGETETNRMGIGSKVKVYRAGKLGDASALLGFQEIAVGYGYCSGQEAVCHFGLGELARCDVEITLPHGSGRVVRSDVPANARLTVQASEAKANE